MTQQLENIKIQSKIVKYWSTRIKKEDDELKKLKRKRKELEG